MTMMTLRIVFVTKSLQIPFRFFAWISSFVFTRVECWDCAWPLDRIFSIAPETCTRSRLAWTISPRDNFLICCSWRPADQYQEIVFIIRVTLLNNYICIYFFISKTISAVENHYELLMYIVLQEAYVKIS